MALAQAQPTNARQADNAGAIKTTSTAHRPDRPFYSGVYLYEYQLARVAEEQGQEYFAFLESQLKILKHTRKNASL